MIRYFMTVRSTVENQVSHQVVLSYFLNSYRYIDDTLFIRHIDGGYRSERNVLMKNNL